MATGGAEWPALVEGCVECSAVALPLEADLQEEAAVEAATRSQRGRSRAVLLATRVELEWALAQAWVRAQALYALEPAWGQSLATPTL